MIPGVVKFIEIDSRLVVARSWEEANGKLFNRKEVSVWKGKKSLDMNDDDGCTTMYLTLLKCTP